MARSFDLVDEKVFEANFFLEKLSTSEFNLFEARCYFSAFVAAARSITFALQAVMTDIEGFKEWYAVQQDTLKANKAARFFHNVRRESQHIGLTPLNSGITFVVDDGQTKAFYYFSDGTGYPLSDAPDTDVVSACHQHLTALVEIIFQCYKRFGSIIDPDQYYTLENLHRLGVTIEDVEESLGFPRGWTDIGPGHEEDRLRLLRRSTGSTEIDYIFEKYLKCTRFSE